MPQIGWLEILSVVIIAILVLGPKEFPIALKKIGSYIGKFKNTLVYNKTDIVRATKTYQDASKNYFGERDAINLIGEYNYFDEELFGSSGFRGGKGFAFRGNDNNIQWIENGFVYSDNLGFEFEEYYKMTDFNTNIIPPDLLHDSLKKKCKSYAQDAFIKLNQED